MDTDVFLSDLSLFWEIFKEKLENLLKELERD